MATIITETMAPRRSRIGRHARAALRRRLARTVRWLRRGIDPRAKVPPPGTLNLALQGGGAHGAFTWGVLDRLLEERRLDIDGISGASAGAVNAVVLAGGWLAGGPEGARAALDRFWRALAASAAVAHRSLLERWLLGRVPGWSLWPLTIDVASSLVSPYQFNPLGINPLLDLLERHVDFAALRAAARPRLFVAATAVRTGRPRIFVNDELTSAVAMASACLPTLFPAVAIEGEHYWDGGFTANPPLRPMIAACATPDTLIVAVNPALRDGLPRNARDIATRLNQIQGNAPLDAEREALEEAARLARASLAVRDRAWRRRLRAMRLHRIDAGPGLNGLDSASKLHPEWSLVAQLRDHGRDAASAWLAARPGAVATRPDRGR